MKDENKIKLMNKFISKHYPGQRENCPVCKSAAGQHQSISSLSSMSSEKDPDSHKESVSVLSCRGKNSGRDVTDDSEGESDGLEYRLYHHVLLFSMQMPPFTQGQTLTPVGGDGSEPTTFGKLGFEGKLKETDRTCLKFCVIFVFLVVGLGASQGPGQLFCLFSRMWEGQVRI